MKQLKIVISILLVIFSIANLPAQNVEITRNYPVSLSDSINTNLNKEMYFSIQCNMGFNGIMYADISGLEFQDEREISTFFDKCPYAFLNINIVVDQQIAIASFDWDSITSEQKNWNCDEWGMYFKNALTEQRQKMGYFDFRKSP